MTFFTSISWLKSCISAGCLYLCYRLYWELTTGASHRRQIQANGCKPIYILRHRDPLFGIDCILNARKAIKEHSLLAFNQSLFTKHDVYTLEHKIVSQPRLILTIEPDNIKTIQATNFNSWAHSRFRKLFLAPLVGEGIFTADGQVWKDSREMIRPSFRRSEINDFAVLERHVHQLIQAIPRNGSTFDLQPLFFSFTFDVGMDFLIGEKINSLDPEIRSHTTTEFIKDYDLCLKIMSKPGIISLVLPSKRLKRAAKNVHAFIDSYIERSLADYVSDTSKDMSQVPSRHTFLQHLVSSTTSKLRIRWELMNVLFAGRDGTAALLSNVWFELSKRPDIWAQLRQEVDTLGGTPPSPDQLASMRYLRAVINESLRLAPIAPENNRQALVDTVLPRGGGEDGKSPIFVAKGSTVVWSAYSMHRREDIYGEDAELFRPERWLDQSKEGTETKGIRPGWAYLPFGGGPRSCIGQQFALTEVSYTTVRLMQELGTLESRDPEPWRERLTLILYLHLISPQQTKPTFQEAKMTMRLESKFETLFLISFASLSRAKLPESTLRASSCLVIPRPPSVSFFVYSVHPPISPQMLSSTRFVAIALLSLFLLAFLLTSLLTLKTSALLNTFLPLRAPTAPIPLTLFPLHANLTSRSCTLQVHLTGTPSTLHLLTASILTHPNITTTNNNNNTNTISEREASLISTTSSASLHPTGATLTISSSLRHPLSITHLGSFLNDKDANAQWPLQIGYGDESWNPAQGDRCWLGPVARKPEGLKEKRALWEQDFECGFECAEEKAE